MKRRKLDLLLFAVLVACLTVSSIGGGNVFLMNYLRGGSRLQLKIMSRSLYNDQGPEE